MPHDGCMKNKQKFPAREVKRGAYKVTETAETLGVSKVGMNLDRIGMLSEEGDYPSRVADMGILYPEWVERRVMPVSPWFADWENSLARAGWVSIRKLPHPDATEKLPYEEMDPAMPEDADLYCPQRNIYLSLSPSTFPYGDDVWAFEAIQHGYPGSFLVIHARVPESGVFEAADGGAVKNLLTAEDAHRCFDLKALVEFNGTLYEPTAAPDENGESLWLPSRREDALEVYREYQANSSAFRGAAGGA